MKKYLKFIYILGIILFINACGGGDNTQEGGDEQNKIVIIDCNNSNNDIGVNDCGDSTVPDYYTCLKSNDTIVNTTDDTNVSIVHDIDDNKKVCTLNGSAYILR